jgi:hypothetical protein
MTTAKSSLRRNRKLRLARPWASASGGGLRLARPQGSAPASASEGGLRLARPQGGSQAPYGSPLRKQGDVSKVPAAPTARRRQQGDVSKVPARSMTTTVLKPPTEARRRQQGPGSPDSSASTGLKRSSDGHDTAHTWLYHLSDSHVGMYTGLWHLYVGHVSA